MKVKILGCGGGIGNAMQTTALLIDNDVLIDCGTGVNVLSYERLSKIRHVFLTHAHLDHIAGLPLLADALFNELKVQPLTVYARPETLAVLYTHIFNWQVWPDFFALPIPEQAVLKALAMTPGEVVWVGGRRVEMIEASHAVPAAAYRVSDEHAAFAFTGDTTTNDTIWAALNRHDRLDLLLVECAFPEAAHALSMQARHYTPSLLAQDLEKLKHRPQIGISHLKPGTEEMTFADLKRRLCGWDIRRLHDGEVFTL